MEIWRKYPQNPKYLVSNYGKVKSLYNSQRLGKPGRMLSCNPDNNGYPRVFVKLEGEGYNANKCMYLHRLVAETYVDNPLELPEVNHIDGNKTNNHEDNLEWVTHQENIQKAWDNGQFKARYGKDHWNYGRKASDHTKKLQSISKMGILHPKYTGYYLINGAKFYSSSEAASALGGYARTIHRRCHNPSFKNYEFVPDPYRIG